MTDSNASVPVAGQPAPAFSLPSTAGETVSLAALRGRSILLAFFPLAFTSTCTAELCEMRDDYDRFAATGVVVHPVSVDSVATLKEFRAKHDLKADMLSDFMRDASRAYGTLLEERFYSNRAYFLIDGTGVVRWAHVEASPGDRRRDAEIFAEIAKLG
jgi:peroxiredoxin